MDFDYCLAVTTTPHICGTPVSIGSSSSIFSQTSGISSYTCKYYQWTSSIKGTITLNFQLRNDASFWYLDDVSVSDENVEMLANGGFESGALSPGWIRSTPNGGCGGGTNGAEVVSSSAHTGIYALRNKCNGVADQLSQSFTVAAGQVYFISFWIKGSGSGSGVSVSVTLS